MKLSSTQTKAINAYAGFIDAGMTYGEAMRKAASELGGTPCPTFLEALAKVHAEKYKCSYTWNGTGNAVFHTGKESTRETRHDAAHKSWQRNVMVWFKEPKQTKPKSHARLTAEARKAAEAYLTHFESVADAIAALRAVSAK